MTSPQGRLKSLEEVQAFAVGHWIRIEALTIFNERVASPSEVADAIGLSLNAVGHHIKELLDRNCIELVSVEPKGGWMEHYYRAIKRAKISDEEWRAMGPETRREVVAHVFRNFMAEGLSSIRSGKMSEDENLRLSWKSANLDAQGRAESAQEQKESLERQEEIEARAAKRMNETGEEGVSTIVAVMSFTRTRNVPPIEDSPPPGEV